MYVHVLSAFCLERLAGTDRIYCFSLFWGGGGDFGMLEQSYIFKPIILVPEKIET